MMKFLIADDHPLYREALKSALEQEFTSVKFIESDSFTSTLAVIRKHRVVNLVLLDLNMPGCENFYGLLRIRERYPDLKIIVISASDDIQTVSQVLEYGANGFAPKTLSTKALVDAIQKVLDNQKYIPADMVSALEAISKETYAISQKVKSLTPKQFQVLLLVKKGLSNKAIAEYLNVTEATVKAHISSLFKRLEVKSRTQILVAVDKLKLE